MKKNFLFLVVAFLIIGCGPSYRWLHTSHNDAYILGRDRTECDSIARANARLQMANLQKPAYKDSTQAMVGIFLEAFTEGMWIKTYFNNCMQARGYYKEELKRPVEMVSYRQSPASESDNQRKSYLELINVNFYESDGRSAIPKQQRRYSAAFSKHHTRYVLVECTMKNTLANVRDQDYELTYMYTDVDRNRLIWKKVHKHNVKKEWKTAWFSNGTGWPQFGKWTPGSYRVDILINGEGFASSTFDITDNKIDVIAEDQTEQSKAKTAEGGNYKSCELECIRKSLFNTSVPISQCVEQMCTK